MAWQRVAIVVVELDEGAWMRKGVFNLSILMLLALVAARLCPAQQAAQANAPLFPIIYGSKDDGLPRRLTARGTISKVHYAPPRSCGELIFAAALEIKLDAGLSRYRHPFLYLVVPCLYKDEGAEKLLNQHIELTATKQEAGGRSCFFDIKTSEIDSGGVPFYCAHREELLKAVMRSPISSTKELIEFEGWLEQGRTYRALVALDREQLWRTVVPLRPPFHHAARIEWLNLKDYPALNKPETRAGRRQIVFKVEKRETYKVAGQYRWNTTYYCRITAIE